MMVVCIELRIPLFLVGKPGSSKSLAKTIVADAMQGRSGEIRDLQISQIGKDFVETFMLILTNLPDSSTTAGSFILFFAEIQCPSKSVL